MENQTTSSTLPIAFKQADRELLHAAADRCGKPDSTFAREVVVEVAHILLSEDP